MMSIANTSLDSLVLLGEAIGAIDLDYPEGYFHLQPRKWNGENIIEKLENFLGFSLNFPNPYPDEIGAWTTRGVVSYRAPQALYQALMIKKLTEVLKIQNLKK